MSSSTGKVLARRVANEVCFLVAGRVCANQCPALRQFAEDALSCGATAILVDLRDCTHCDSTFLGTLLRFRHSLASQGPGALRLVCPSAPVRQILAQIGGDRLFDIVEYAATTPSEATWQQLADNFDCSQKMQFKQHVVEAHQALAKEGGELAKRFGPLAEAMHQEYLADQTPQQGSVDHPG